MSASTVAVNGARAEKLPFGTVFAYSLPSAVLGFTYMLTGVYLLKYAADVLLVAPGIMGLLFGLSRIWDAVSDPLAGYLSDRTRTRLGRRRSWILASALPIGFGFWMVWSPPALLTGSALTVWMGVGVFAYFTATTIFSVPHEALAAELSTDHHERTRIFGIKTATYMTGSLLGLGGMALLITSDDPRGAAVWLARGAIVAMIVFVGIAVSSVRERPDYQGRGATRMLSAFRDVLRNPHATLLLLVFFIENFGTSILAATTPFVMAYVFDMENLTPVFMGMYFIPALLFVPIWIRLSRRFGKKKLWVFSMSMLCLAFSGLFFVGEGDVTLICALGLIAGVGGGCGQVVGPSIQADVIDYDEYKTGQRKEGAYFAVWNFVRKSATGLAVMLTGLLLSVVGFEPNAEQNEAAKLGMRALFSAVPGTCFLIGTLTFLRFRLTEREHDEIRRALDERR